MNERSWLDAWMGLTTWWVEPAVAAVQAAPAQADQMLAQLIEGVAKRFGGGRIELTVRGHRVRASLDSLRILRRNNARELRVDTSDVDVDGLALYELSIVAHSVRVEPGIEPTLVIGELEMEGRAELEPVVAFMDQRIGGWSLGVHDGNVTARRRPSEPVLVVQPRVRDDIAYVELRGIHWRGARVPLPRWLRYERRVPLTLDPDWSVVEAVRTGDEWRFRMRAPSIEQRVSTKNLREAVLRGGRLAL